MPTPKKRSWRRKQLVDPRLLTKTAAAAYLGISVEMFERNVSVPFLKIGRRELVDVRDLDKMIDASKEGGRLMSFEEMNGPDFLEMFDRHMETRERMGSAQRRSRGKRGGRGTDS